MSQSSESSESDPLRPADHIDSQEPSPSDAPTGARLGFVGWLRFLWRQLTSMRTAIILLLLLALGAVPGSLVPQESSDPNGVIQVRAENPDLVWLYDALDLHHVYSSPWFSAIYILLFVSLVGCVLPRTKHHWKALRTPPPKTPARLSRLVGFTRIDGDASDIDGADRTLKRLGYRTRRFGDSVSAERGYLRETGNLVFHASLVGILLAVAIGSGWGYSGQRLVVEGQSFANSLSSYDSFNESTWFDADQLPDYAVTLDDLAVEYETENQNAVGAPLDFTASVTVTDDDGSTPGIIKVNEPLSVDGNDLYLVSNGYAPEITVRDPEGTVIWSDVVPFLAQDDKLTSLGVIKIPDGLADQLGLRGFFYPTAVQLDTGALASAYPDLVAPMLSLQAFTGDLGLDDGIPRSVYALDTEGMTQVAGGESGTESLTMAPGESLDLPDGLGTISFDSVRRYAVIDVHHDPTQLWVLSFALLIVASLLVSLFIPRRRVWVKATPAGLEIAGLARGDDPGLERAVTDIAERLRPAAPPGDVDDPPPDAEPDHDPRPEPEK